jgi:hypothetical protein
VENSDDKTTSLSSIVIKTSEVEEKTWTLLIMQMIDTVFGPLSKTRILNF